jgi:hypothetical protein
LHLAEVALGRSCGALAYCRSCVNAYCRYLRRRKSMILASSAGIISMAPIDPVYGCMYIVCMYVLLTYVDTHNTHTHTHTHNPRPTPPHPVGKAGSLQNSVDTSGFSESALDSGEPRSLPLDTRRLPTLPFHLPSPAPYDPTLLHHVPLSYTLHPGPSPL